MKELIHQLLDDMNSPTSRGAVKSSFVEPGSPFLTRLQELQMLSRWHALFFSAVRGYLDGNHAEARARKAFCGFNIVNDEIYYVASGDDFRSLVEAWGCSLLPQTQAPGSPSSPAQALSCLIEMIRSPQAPGKYSVLQSHVLAMIRGGAESAGLHRARFLGGAAGNMAYILGHLGVDTVLHCPYHAEGPNWRELNQDVQYVTLGESGAQAHPIRQPSPGLPYKTTAGFQICPGWSVAELGLEALESARALFVSRQALLPGGGARERVSVVWPGAPDPVSPEQGDAGWPYPQIVSLVEEDDGDLRVLAPDRAEMLAALKPLRCSVALLGGLGDVQNPNLLDDIRKNQLIALREAGVAVHTELSGTSDLLFLSEMVRDGRSALGAQSGTGGGWSVGLNQTDVDKLVTNDYLSGVVEDPSVVDRNGEDPRPLVRLLKGWDVLKQLDVDWVYIHGNDMDLTVWKRSTDHTWGPRLRDAMLLAKAAVVAGMIHRIVPPYLWPLIHHQLQASGLASKGFAALSRFAVDLDRWAAKAGSKAFGANIRDEVLETGITSGDSFGISVAPVYWPTDVAPFLSATGAGDFTSAVVAAYAW